MSVADSISVFAEGTFEEQILELVTYTAKSRPESEREAFRQPYDDALKTEEGQKPLEEDLERRRHVFGKVVDAIDGLGEGPDREAEGFFNLVLSHLFSLYDAKTLDAKKIVEHLLKVILTSSSPEHTHLKFRILGNLFNAVPRTSPLRLLVCKALVRFASDNDEMDTLHMTLGDVNRWTSEWDVSTEDKAAFLKFVADAYLAANQQETAFTYLQSYVQSIPTSATAAKTAGLELIVSALRLPNSVDTDSLLKLENVQALQGHPLHTLIQVFSREDLDEYRKWQGDNEASLKEFGLDKAQLERKMRILILASLGFNRIGGDIPYSEIASALHIEVNEVEKWVIDVIRTGLLSGKLSQTTQTFHVIRALPRSFGNDEWRALERRLVAWRVGLEGVRAVLAQTARQSQGQGQSALPAGQATAQALA